MMVPASYFSSKARSCACWSVEIGSGGATIGFKPNALAAVVLLLLCDGSRARDGRAAGAGVGRAVGAADVVAGGVLSGNMAPVGILPEGGGTGPNKLFPELEAEDFAGTVLCAGTAAAGGLVGGCLVAPEGVTATGGGWAAGTFVTFVVGAAAAWLDSIAGGFATAG